MTESVSERVSGNQLLRILVRKSQHSKFEHWIKFVLTLSICIFTQKEAKSKCVLFCFLFLSNSAEVVIAALHSLTELERINLGRIGTWQNVIRAADNVNKVEMLAETLQGTLDLINGHKWCVVQARKLLHQAHTHTWLLHNARANVTSSVANSGGFLAIFHLGQSKVGIFLIIGSVENLWGRQDSGVVVAVEHAITEFVVGDLTVFLMVEMTHKARDLVLTKLEAELLEGLAELVDGDDAVMAQVEATEDVTNRRHLCAHAFAELFEDRLQIILEVRTAFIEVLAGILIHVVNVEVPCEHLKLVVYQIPGSDVLAGVLVHVNTLSQERTTHNTAVADRRLVNCKSVIFKIE